MRGFPGPDAADGRFASAADLGLNKDLEAAFPDTDAAPSAGERATEPARTSMVRYASAADDQGLNKDFEAAFPDTDAAPERGEACDRAGADFDGPLRVRG